LYKETYFSPGRQQPQPALMAGTARANPIKAGHAQHCWHKYVLILLGDPAARPGLSSPPALLNTFSEVHVLFLISSLDNDPKKTAW